VQNSHRATTARRAVGRRRSASPAAAQQPAADASQPRPLLAAAKSILLNFLTTRRMKSANSFSDAPSARDRIVVEVDILKDKVLSPPSRFLMLPSNRALRFH
jgi:hypothetical protein